MATTSIGADRNGAGWQVYYDAAFLRDNIYLYFGTDGDASMRWSTGNSRLDITGAVQFASLTGFTLKVTLTSDLAVGGQTTATKKLTVSSDLILDGIPQTDPGVSDTVYVSGSDLKVSTAS